VKVQAASREIRLPELPVVLAGHGRFRTAVRVDSSLEVNCLLVSDGESRVLLVSLDVLYITSKLRTLVLDEIKSVGLTDEQLFFAASHTHNAPSIDDTKPLLGDFDPQSLRVVADAVLDAIHKALEKEPQVAEVAVSQGVIPFGVNRRLYRFLRLDRQGIRIAEVGMGPNPAGETDPFVTYVEIRVGRTTVACLWSAACHPTSQPDERSVSADYPGVVRKHLRARLADMDTVGSSNELPVLFFQGCSGDVRPPSGRVTKWTARELAKRILLGRLFHPLSKSEYETWTSVLAEQVWELAKSVVICLNPRKVDYSRIERPASGFAIIDEHRPPVSFHQVTIGPLLIVGASAELVSAYGHLVRAMAPGYIVIPIGCIDHVIGYWPTRDMFREGGYEVSDHCGYFGIVACDPDVEMKFQRNVQELFKAI